MLQGTDAAPTSFESDDERLRSFGQAISAIRDSAEARVGDDDVRYVVRLDRLSRTLEVLGRTLLHFSLEPVSFTVGVTCLFVHKQLQTAEIGHTALHGAYDRLEGAERFHSQRFRWDPPIDEASWRKGHNHGHHQFTNIAERDPDINFGSIRLTEQTPHRPRHYAQLASTFLFSVPFFAHAINLHVTGMLDDVETRDAEEVRAVRRRVLRKLVPHLAKEYLLFPALAGPMFWKVALGNWMSERMRDVWSAATIYCGHVGEDVASYPEGARASTRGRWFAMQVEASNDFTVAFPFNVLCGGLEHQIEHHLFPKLPPPRLREVAAEVERACRDHGVAYRSDSWGRTLSRALRQVARLSLPTPRPVPA